MEVGAAWEATLHIAQSQASQLRWVQGTLQCIQRHTPEIGALCTYDQWFVFLYLHTDSFLYLILVSILT